MGRPAYFVVMAKGPSEAMKICRNRFPNYTPVRARLRDPPKPYSKRPYIVYVKSKRKRKKK